MDEDKNIISYTIDEYRKGSQLEKDNYHDWLKRQRKKERRLRDNEIQKIYSFKNKDKVNEWQRKWYSKHKDKKLEANRKWRSKNKDKINEYSRKSYSKNKDKINEYRRKWYSKNKTKDLSLDKD